MLDPATLKAVYLDTGLYRRILDQQFKLIATYLNNITFGSRDIVVFDIDEVCLSSLMHVAPEYACEHSDATDTVIIEECMQVFRVLEHKGAGYAFVTGRKERIRAETRDDLTRVGLGEYVALYMCPGEYGKSVACFKAVCREDLVMRGMQVMQVMQVTRRGAEIPKTPETLRLVRKELTVTPATAGNPCAFPTPFKVYVDAGDTLVVPLHWASKRFAPDNKRERCTPTNLQFVGALKPELHQPEAVEAVRRSWEQTGGAVLCLATGLGKTTCALYVAVKAGLQTMVVVHKEFLATQWEERIAAHVPGAKVTRVQGTTCDTSGDFVIAMLQTLVSRKYPASTFASVGVVVVDECHHISAPGFSQAMWGLGAPFTLGLTATPDRRDGLGRIITWFMGDIAYQKARTNAMTTTVHLVYYDCPAYKAPPPINRRGDVCYASIMRMLVEDEARTRVVADKAVELAEQGRDVLVLSHRRAHCLAISDLVRAGGVPCSTYMGGDVTVPDSQVIVATYALTSEGFDCPRLTALVLATPSSDVVQACGRVMRGCSGNTAVIVDVVDKWSVCYSQSLKRSAFYKKSGFGRPTTGFAFIPDPPPG